jgi:hypothetical protein
LQSFAAPLEALEATFPASDRLCRANCVFRLLLPRPSASGKQGTPTVNRLTVLENLEIGVGLFHQP